MEVAIETSTIVASFMRALTNADLAFFSDSYIEPKFVPKTVEKVSHTCTHPSVPTLLQVIELAIETRTVGSTCHASALWPYYEKRKIVKTFIICTDEEENANYKPKSGPLVNSSFR